MKFKTYSGETITDVLVTRKIDGVRAHRTETGIVSRTGKPLYNVTMNYKVAEIFLGTWEKTISAVHTRNGSPIPEECIFSLDPVDPRLVIGFYNILTTSEVQQLFKEQHDLGYEGLVLQTKDYWYKVKEKETYDTKVTGIVRGTGRNINRMGALQTEKGKVGIGFSDLDREYWFNLFKIGAIIEVESMGLTPNGKFRHPRFIRERFDKEIA